MVKERSKVMERHNGVEKVSKTFTSVVSRQEC